VKLRGFIFLLLFSAGLAQAQEEEIFRHPLGPQTADAFRTTCARLAQHTFIRGNFEQEKTLSRLERSLKSSGIFIIAAGQGMVWDTVKPFPSTLTLGRDFMIQSRPGGQRTVLSAQGNETFLRMAEVLSAVFSGNAQGLLDNFAIYYSGGVSGDTVVWELGLSPLDKAINSFAERIVMKGDAAIRSIQIYEQNGDSIRYILSNHNYPAELNAHERALFSYP
jgi:outer membrane lipoprotein-sorting protein